MDTKHTPGPWISTRGLIQAALPDGLRPTVALVAATTTSAEANAHLITAAPDMLAALILAEEAMSNVCNCGECGGCEATKAIREAIAKAKGGAQ